MKKRSVFVGLLLRIICIAGIIGCIAYLIILSLPEWKIQSGSVSEPVRSSSVYQAGISAVTPVSAEININTADVETLCTLYGIGTSKANAIIEYRENQSPFYYPQDIIYVSGIGETTYENNKDKIGI